MEIDYKIIMMDGFLRNGKYFPDYLVREYNKIKDHGYSADEFFDRCLDVIIWIEKTDDPPIELNLVRELLSKAIEKVQLAENQVEIKKRRTLESKKNEVAEILKPLSGYWREDKIMNDTYFESLKQKVFKLIESDELPSSTNEFPYTKIHNEFIRRTIYEVYLSMGKKNRSAYIDLVHLFSQFEDTEKSTTDKKFASYQGNYQNDILNLITY